MTTETMINLDNQGKPIPFTPERTYEPDNDHQAHTDDGRLSNLEREVKELRRLVNSLIAQGTMAL